MALTINMCNDVEKYEESVVAGLNGKKTLYLIVAFIAGGALASIFYFVLHVPLLIDVYLMIPVVAPIILMGFYSKNGMSFLVLVKKGFHMGRRNVLSYRSTENAASYVRLRYDDEDKMEEKRRHP